MTMLLPPLSGRRLDGRPVTLPDDLEAPTLLLVAYLQWQQRQVDTWLAARPTLRDVGADYLEVPLLSWRWLPGRAWIDGGMSAGMNDDTRAHTMTVYANPTAFRRRLGLPLGQIGVLLTLPGGQIAYRASGALSAASKQGLLRALDEANGRASAWR
jgi:hypothetical protein